MRFPGQAETSGGWQGTHTRKSRKSGPLDHTSNGPTNSKLIQLVNSPTMTTLLVVVAVVSRGRCINKLNKSLNALLIL